MHFVLLYICPNYMQELYVVDLCIRRPFRDMIGTINRAALIASLAEIAGITKGAVAFEALRRTAQGSGGYVEIHCKVLHSCYNTGASYTAPATHCCLLSTSHALARCLLGCCMMSVLFCCCSLALRPALQDAEQQQQSHGKKADDQLLSSVSQSLPNRGMKLCCLYAVMP